MHRIVIADPDVATRHRIARSIRGKDLRVEEVACGTEALQRVAQKRVDVLIVEVHLADFPAWELISRVRELDRDVLIVTVTADDCWETSRKVYKRGPPLYYALKPVCLETLQKLLHWTLRWKDETAGRRAVARWKTR